MATTVTAGIGTLTLGVTGCTGNGVSPIVLTIGSGVPASVAVGQEIVVASVGGNTNANGTKTVTAVGATTITFAGTGNGDYTSGGTVARTHLTIQAWVTATTGNLVAADQVRVGELYDDANFTVATGTALSISGSTTDATRYRVLRAWSGHRYDPFDRSGARIIRDVSDSQLDGIVLGEAYARLQGFYLFVQDDGPVTTGTVRGIRLTSNSAQVDSVVVEMSEGDSSGSISWRCFSHSAGTGTQATRATFTNCVAIGSGTAGLGATHGFQSSIAWDRAFNCVAYRVAGGATATGIVLNGGNTEVRNCIALESAWNDFLPASTFDHNVSSDNTATGVGSFTQGDASLLFINAPLGDFRLRQSGFAVDSGVDLSAVFTTDLAGSTRTPPWEIGAYDSFGALPSSAPTVVVSSIGSAGGRDYATIAAWESATRLHLVSLNVVHVGELYDDSDFVVSGVSVSVTAVYDRAVTDATRYRVLRAAAGHRYDPILDAGVLVTGGTSGGSIVRSWEDYFRIEGVKLEHTDAGAGNAYCLTLEGVGNVADGVFGAIEGGTGGTRAVFQVTGASCRVRNCIAVGNSNSDGADVGFLSSGSGAHVQNCAATRVRRGASGTCFKDGGSGATLFENCVAGTSDVGFSVTDGWQRYCASIDATAQGQGAKPSLLAADIWTDAAANDLRPKAGGAIINAGVKLAHEFNVDFTGAQRGTSWEMGPYDGYLAPPAFAVARSGSPLLRRCACWEFERRDGTTLNFTDHLTSVVHLGVTYSPTGSFDATNRRREWNMAGNSVDLNGPVSAVVTFDDLRAGRYARARAVERVVDPEFPFLASIATSVYVVRDVTFDSERWVMQLGGLTERMRNKVGRVYSRGCGHVLGDSGCRVDLTALTQFDVAVTSVASRHEFSASGLPSGGVYVDGWFALGIVSWRTGANAGLTFDVLSYVASGKTLKTFMDAPFDVEVGDTFDVSPGCDLSLATCRDKFDNVVNFGGFKHVPGTDKALQTPVA